MTWIKLYVIKSMMKIKNMSRQFAGLFLLKRRAISCRQTRTTNKRF